MPSSRSNQSRTVATRAALISAARTLFAEKGFAETSTPEIVSAASVTRGALYHHFEDKEALFRAVVIEEFSAVASEIDASALSDPDSPMVALKQGSRGFLDAMNDAGRLRIMLLDGPAVLGRAQIRQIDMDSSTMSLRKGLELAIQSGSIKPMPLDALSSQLSALFDRAALAIADGESRESHIAVIDNLIDGLALL